MEITEFSATLYFDSEPRLSGHVLSEAWSRQGYVCETQESDAAFQGFRGGTYVVVEHPVPADLSQHPRSFPAMAEVEVDYGSTYCIDHKAGYADFLRASFQSELTFRIVADPQDRKTAHNEWAATMLGIHQAYPCAPCGCTTWVCWWAGWIWTSIWLTPTRWQTSRRSSRPCWRSAHSSPRTAR